MACVILVDDNICNCVAEPAALRIRPDIKSTGRLPVANLPSCGKVVSEAIRR